MIERPDYLKVVGEAPEPDAENGLLEVARDAMSHLLDGIADGSILGFFLALDGVEPSATVQGDDYTGTCWLARRLASRMLDRAVGLE